jgi:DNA-binding transcriptional LysR family regulator
LFEIIERTVDEIDRLMREQRQSQHHPAARLRTDYAFSQFWLIPRMHAFRLRHPQTDIQIIATQRFRGRCDGGGRYRGCFRGRGRIRPERETALAGIRRADRDANLSRSAIQAAYPPRG